MENNRLKLNPGNDGVAMGGGFLCMGWGDLPVLVLDGFALPQMNLVCSLCPPRLKIFAQGAGSNCG